MRRLGLPKRHRMEDLHYFESEQFNIDDRVKLFYTIKVQSLAFRKKNKVAVSIPRGKVGTVIDVSRSRASEYVYSVRFEGLEQDLGHPEVVVHNIKVWNLIPADERLFKV